MRVFLSSDYHLGHCKVNEYENSPFATPELRNQRIISNHNSRVKPEDQFIHNGDFCFKSGPNCKKAEEWAKELNGKHIFILGNHDKSGGNKTYIESMQLKFANTKINIVHKPEHSNPNYEVNLVGHVHQNWRIRSFKQHYNILERLISEKKELIKDRPDLIPFLEKQVLNRNSDSILLNVGVAVQKYIPLTLDECIGQVIQFRKGL